jgi:tRNA (cytidine32/uridine32-2'-O)-methyltransferase
MSAQLNNISIVLVSPSHGGNIGGVARAMKNMGLSRLRLVDPADHLSPEASARAAGAVDILKSALVYPSLADALKDCRFVVGASARPRSVVWPTLTAPEAAGLLCEKSAADPVALVFGREQSGL